MNGNLFRNSQLERSGEKHLQTIGKVKQQMQLLATGLLSFSFRSSSLSQIHKDRTETSNYTFFTTPTTQLL